MVSILNEVDATLRVPICCICRSQSVASVISYQLSVTFLCKMKSHFKLVFAYTDMNPDSQLINPYLSNETPKLEHLHRLRD
jgi:hypothetical protein